MTSELVVILIAGFGMSVLVDYAYVVRDRLAELQRDRVARLVRIQALRARAAARRRARARAPWEGWVK